MPHKIKLQKTATQLQRCLKMKNVHETVPFPSPCSVDQWCTKLSDCCSIVEHLFLKTSAFNPKHNVLVLV